MDRRRFIFVNVLRLCLDSLFRRELYATGITVHMLEPGYFETPMVQFFTPETVKRLATEKFDKLSQEIKENYGEEFIEKSNNPYLNSLLSAVWWP